MDFIITEKNFQRPDSWTYWDDHIPKWYEAWKQQEEEDEGAGVS